MSWEVESEGETSLNPSKNLYLIEITTGTSTKKSNDGEVPIKREDGCPMMRFNAKVLMDKEGKESFRNYPFGIYVADDERGHRILRLMLRAMLPDSHGKVAINPSTFNGKVAWVDCEYARGFFNCDHQTWQKRDAIKVATAIRTSGSDSASESPPQEENLPF